MKWFGRVEYDRIQCHHTLDQRPDPSQFAMHTHTELELFYFVSGSGRYRVEGQLYELRPGDILLLRTAETHCLQISPAQPYERVAIHFSADLLQNDAFCSLLQPFTDRPLGTENRYTAEELPAGFVRQCMERLFRHAPGSEGEILAYLLPLLQELYGVWHLRTRGREEVQADLSAQLVAYINLHLTELDGLQQLEKKFFLSQSQINRIFRRATGASVWEYVQVKRLFAARDLLYAGTPPSQAAQACGYREYTTFYRAYRKRFGHAPQQDQHQGGV